MCVYVRFHNKAIFTIIKLLTSIIKFKKVYIFNTLTKFFYLGNYCYSIYNVKLFNPNFNDPTFRYCNGGAYGNFYSNYLLNIKKNFHFIDIGANIGIYSLIASKNKNCNYIYAFEPNPEVFTNLKKNLERLVNAKIINSAISNKSGEIDFYIDPKSSGSSQINNFKSNFKIKSINGSNLKKIINKDKFFNIKIDVEGHEVVVLNEIINSITLKKINSIYIEIANNKNDYNYFNNKLDRFNLIYFKKSKKRCDCLFEKI